MKLGPPIAKRLEDPDAEQVRRSHAQAITELQGLPAAGLKVIKGVSLPNGKDVFVSHGLGREPSIVLVSPPYPNIATVGAIHEVRGVSGAQAIDRSRAIVLKADGFGLTVTVDVAVL